jgi:hypothetical protein
MRGPLAPLLPTPHCGRDAVQAHRNRQKSIMYVIRRMRGDARLVVVRGRAIEFARSRLAAWGLGLVGSLICSHSDCRPVHHQQHDTDTP